MGCALYSVTCTFYTTARCGEVAKLADASGDAVVKKGVRTLAWFVLVGWAIYPIGYFMGYMAGGVELNVSSNVDCMVQHRRCNK